MLTGLFVMIVVTALVLHYVFVGRQSEEGIQPALALPEPIPLAKAIEDLPEGIFLQPTFTWTRMRKNGEIFLGLHPMLTSLIGVDYSLELLADDARIEKGTPLLRILQGERELQLFSPVEGQIVEATTDFSPLPGWKGSTMRGGSWIYIIKPTNAEEEIPLWLLGDDAQNWAHQQYREVRDFLFQTDTHHEVGLAAADGGELPAGILSQLDPSVWEAFQLSFLPPPGEATEA
jgi:glycine cleavage system H lipoate-binding protein